MTGSSGFIGRHLRKRLRQQKHKVRPFDSVIGRDIRNSDQLLKAVQGVDCVAHLASLVQIPYSFNHPGETNDVNVTGTVRLLEACRKSDVKRIVFSSSCAVYGAPDYLPVKEDHPLNPTSPYGLTKKIGEQYLRLYHELYGLTTISLRCFNVYGNGQSKGVIGNWLRAIAAGKPLTIFGDGRQTRDFVHVGDVVNSIIGCLHTKSSPIASGEYNIGSGVETSIMGLAQIIQSMVGAQKIKIEPERMGDIRRIYGDISKASCELGHVPRVSLSEGIKELITARKALATVRRYD